MKEAILGLRQFADGGVRTVILDVEGRQYVRDENDCRVYGEWLDPESFEPDHCRVVSSGDASASPVSTTDVQIDDCSQQLADFQWIESERVGYDIVHEYAIHAWVREHWTGHLRSKLLEHLLGYKYWSEMDKGDFGLLRNAFQNDIVLIDRVIDRLKVNHENLEILIWAQDWGISVESVVRILEALDINSRRLSPRFEM